MYRVPYAHFLSCSGEFTNVRGMENAVPTEYYLSADRSLLQFDFIVRSLQGTYWAAGRPEEVIRAAWDKSICFGVYSKRGDDQVAFARAVTDGATFTWLADVFVDPAHRGKGLARALVAAALADAAVARTNIHLGTRDAHGLYEKFGFVRTETMRKVFQPAPAPLN